MRPTTAIGGLLTVAALALLAYGVWKANPLVSFGTTGEITSQEAGRTAVYLACCVLLAAAALLVGQVGVVAALVVAEPGIVCALLVAVAPHTAYALIAFVVLGPLAMMTLAYRLFRGSAPQPPAGRA